MIEIELVASWVAASEHGLYSENRFKENGSQGLALALNEACRASANKLHHHLGPQRGDVGMRISDAVRQLSAEAQAPDTKSLDGKRLWQAVKRLVSERVQQLLHDPNCRPWAIDFFRSMDMTFFAPARVPTGKGIRLPVEGDAHIHVGGAVPWDAIWQRHMTGQHPVVFMNWVSWRLIPKGQAASLIKHARWARVRLFQATGLAGLREADPGADHLLFERIRITGADDNDDTWRDVCRYVTIRGLFRREMIAANLTSLDEFTQSQWKRFWGGFRASHPPFFSSGIIRRALNLERWKMEQACDLLEAHGVGRASLRFNLDPKPAAVAKGTLESAAVVSHRLQVSAGLGEPCVIVVHGRRPNSLDREKQKNSLVQWEQGLRYLENLILKNYLSAKDLGLALDLAGPERNCRNDTFGLLLDKTFGFAKANTLGVTVHAGEDFFDPFQGLWRVWAVLTKAKENTLVPRIGHGSVLGIDPYVLKWSQFYCPRLARKDGLNGAHDIAGKLKVAMPRELLTERQILNAGGGGDDEVTSLLFVQPSREEQCFFFALQKKIIEKLAEAKAIIESNPTSNALVLDLSGYEHSPFWGLFAQRSKGLRVVLGTDNPGFCFTTIDEEYNRLAEAHPRRQNLEGNNHIPHHLRIEKMTWRDIEQSVRQDTRRFALVK